MCALVAVPREAAAAPFDALTTPLTWAVLAAVGLGAVVIGAWSLRGRPGERSRPADDDAGDLRDLGAAAHFVSDLRASTLPPAAAAPTSSVPAASAVPSLPAAVRTRNARVADASPVPIVPPPTSVDDAMDALPDDAAGSEPPAAAAVAGADDDASRIFLALQHVDLSIDVLRRHLAQETRPMPAVWVMLLDLCRTHGREAAFRDIAADFHARFNVAAPSWENYPPDRAEPGLEAYPRIVKELTQCWGTHECRRLLDRLLFDNRSGGRRGFTLNAYNDLIALRRAADVVLDTIEQDFAEESKVRDAYAQAATGGGADGEGPAPSPLVRDLESQCDTDLRERSAEKSALESEHPALADAVTREWRNGALAGRLAEMLARSDDAAQPLSREARAEVTLLHDMAQRLAERVHPSRDPA